LENMLAKATVAAEPVAKIVAKLEDKNEDKPVVVMVGADGWVPLLLPPRLSAAWVPSGAFDVTTACTASTNVVTCRKEGRGGVRGQEAGGRHEALQRL
jgi:hypothetical protein